ncbi:MAG: tRNA guanosine(34) transglycosylase Tgt [Rhodospirillales bacterium]|nr:tRNA guanosine(34) transglycosylase Tgt [Rhodospirillales bacterium]
MTGEDIHPFAWRVLGTEAAARLGVIATAHGPIRTPAFMPVGTAATVKGLLPEQIREAGADAVLANTYHLMLRPGSERIGRLGGLHRFMNWPGPILTDSGGFQIFSLRQMSRIAEDGATFRSHIDGSRHVLTPERAMAIQNDLDATIAMVLDECTEHPATHERARASMERSMRWAARCKAAFEPRAGYALFGIVQGGTHEDLRRASASALTDIGFDGYAVGGLAVGEGQSEMFRILDATVPHLPPDRPRYLMGVGRPDDILGAVARGIDIFDCVLPTRSGRTGQAFTGRGTVNIRNARHRDDPRPLDATFPESPCSTYSRAYLHHLFRCNEMLGPMLLTLHNVAFYQKLMADIRQALAGGTFATWSAACLKRLSSGDIC